MGYGNIPSWIAIAISLIALFLSLRQYLRKPYVSIGMTQIIDFGDKTLYMLYHLSFHNPSSIAKTIDQIRLIPQEGYQLDEVSPQPHFETGLVTFEPRGIAKKQIAMRFEDILSLPLDVEPHHSKSAFLAVAIHPIELSHLKLRNPSSPASDRLYGKLQLLDGKGNCLAQADLIGPD
jgi:hypothetical protein